MALAAARDPPRLLPPALGRPAAAAGALLADSAALFSPALPYRRVYRLLQDAMQSMATAARINLVDPDIYARGGALYEQFAWLREHGPVFWHADGGGPGWPGFWAVTRHADVTDVIRRPAIFSSVPAPPRFASGATRPWNACA
jgi:cytochrome P450